MERDETLSLGRRKFSRLKENIFIFGNSRLSQLKEFKAVTEDIGAGGLMFKTEEEIPDQGELELEIYQPMDCDKMMVLSIAVLAKVKWIRKIEKDNFEQGENRYMIGVEFIEIREEDRQRIAMYLEECTSQN